MMIEQELKTIYIVGAGGFGREVLQWVKDINRVKQTWVIGGFLDDNTDALKGVLCDYSVAGALSTWQPKENEVFAMAIAEPRTKEKIVKLLKLRGAIFVSVIHPTAVLTDFTTLGEGVIMWPHAKLSVNSCCGDFVSIISTDVGHDITIGNYCFIAANTTLLRNIHIGNRVFIASNAVIANDVSIGDDAYIGMGSIVMKNVESGYKTFANPARHLPS